MKDKMGDDWISAYANDDFKNIVAAIKLRHKKSSLSHGQIVSNLTLGNIIKLIKDNELQGTILDLREADLKSFYEKNTNNIIINSKKFGTLGNFHKATLAIDLLSNIRNRCFHWENLFKLNIDGSPRLSVEVKFNIKNRQIAKIIMGIDPKDNGKHIKDFLDLILKCVS